MLTMAALEKGRRNRWQGLLEPVSPYTQVPGATETQRCLSSPLVFALRAAWSSASGFRNSLSSFGRTSAWML